MYWRKSQCVYGIKQSMIVCVFCVLRYKQQIFVLYYLCHAFSSFYNIIFLLVGVGFEISQYCERFSTAIQSQHTQKYWYLKGISKHFLLFYWRKMVFLPSLVSCFFFAAFWFSRRTIFIPFENEFSFHNTKSLSLMIVIWFI